MANTEEQVAAHYTTEGLVERILQAVEAAGGDRQALSPADLKGVDEFHTGGVEATDALLAQLEITPKHRVLDIGCGIGGTARHIANGTGAHVTGVDLTLAFIDAAQALSSAVGLHQRTRFLQGSALALPVEDRAYDLVTLFHVGMNIADKDQVIQEVARVLAPGGVFALYDVMRVGSGSLPYPMPWAEVADYSFVATPQEYRASAVQARLNLREERDRSGFASEYFDRVIAAAEEGRAASPVGIHLLMRDTAADKLAHYVQSLRAGLIAPVEMIFDRP